MVVVVREVGLVGAVVIEEEAAVVTEGGAEAALWMQMAALTLKLVLHLLALMLLTPQAQ